MLSLLSSSAYSSPLLDIGLSNRMPSDLIMVCSHHVSILIKCVKIKYLQNPTTVKNQHPVHGVQTQQLIVDTINLLSIISYLLCRVLFDR